jgi:hypothetical protein
MFYYADADTEPVGMYLVSGFRKGQLVQLFVVPFYNDIMKGKFGPLDQFAFVAFQKTLLDRSTTDASRYYSDSRSLARLKEGLLHFRLADLRNLRPRYLTYAVGIVFYHYPVLVALIFMAILVLSAWVVRRHRRRTL